MSAVWAFCETSDVVSHAIIEFVTSILTQEHLSYFRENSLRRR